MDNQQKGTILTLLKVDEIIIGSPIRISWIQQMILQHLNVNALKEKKDTPP